MTPLFAVHARILLPLAALLCFATAWGQETAVSPQCDTTTSKTLTVTAPVAPASAVASVSGCKVGDAEMRSRTADALRTLAADDDFRTDNFRQQQILTEYNNSREHDTAMRFIAGKDPGANSHSSPQLSSQVNPTALPAIYAAAPASPPSDPGNAEPPVEEPPPEEAPPQKTPPDESPPTDDGPSA